MAILAGKFNNRNRYTVYMGGAINVWADRNFGGTNPSDKTIKKSDLIKRVLAPTPPAPKDQVYTQSTT